MKHTPPKQNHHKHQLGLVVILFALLGTYLILRTLAATPPSPPIVNSTNAPASAMSTFPDTTNGIHMGLTYSTSVNPPTSLVGKVDYIWGPNAFALKSIHLDGAMPFELDPYAGTVAGHTLQWYQANHPNWVVYQCDGKTPAYFQGQGSKSHVPLDFSNPVVINWQAAYANGLLVNHYDGIAFDDFNFTNYAGRCGVYKYNASHQLIWTLLGYPAQGQSNAKYTTDMVNWIKAMRVQINPAKTIAVNYSNTVNELSSLQAIAPYIDMDMDENGFTTLAKHLPADSVWQSLMSKYDYLNSQNKAFYIVNDFGTAGNSDISRGQINWVLANYLLVKGSHTYLNIYGGSGLCFTGSPCTYGTYYDWPEFHAPIGSATSARYAAQNVYMRNYSGGLAIVNPSSTKTFKVSLGKTYQDLYGNQVSSVTLAPTTAIILLNLPAIQATGGSSSSSGHASHASDKGSSKGKSTPSGGSTTAGASTAGQAAQGTDRAAGTKKVSNPIVVTVQDVKKAKPVYFISALTSVLIVAALSAYWLYHLHRLGRPLLIHLNNTGVEPPRPDSRSKTALNHIHAANGPAPGTVVNPTNSTESIKDS